MIPDVPFVPTSVDTARRMLEIAGVGPEDVVYDLGCGDGRILITAVKEFKAKKAVGYEIMERIYGAAVQEIERQDLNEKITLVKGDLFKADLSEATVITLYLNGSANQRLRPKLEKEARAGARVVSHDFYMEGWKSEREERFKGDDIYLYILPGAIEHEHTHSATWFDAEAITRNFLSRRHRQVELVEFGRAWHEKGVWTVEGNMTVKTDVLFIHRKRFKLQINAKTGEVVKYSETPAF